MASFLCEKEPVADGGDDGSADEGKNEAEATSESENVLFLSVRQWEWDEGACFVCGGKGKLPTKGALASNGQQKSSSASSSSATLPEGTSLRKCSAAYCSVFFHEDCFLSFSEGDFFPQMNILDAFGDPCCDIEKAKKWICPQHACNFCHQELLRTRSTLGTVISCAKCVFAWHRSCVIVGSHNVNSKRDKLVLCPRHTPIEKTSNFNISYCVKCGIDLEKFGTKMECTSCIRSFCGCSLEKSRRKKKRSKAGGRSGADPFVCDFCTSVDYPRIGDYVMARYSKQVYPAKTMHAELIPTSLLKKQSLISKLESPGYVLIQWVEGLALPNYDVVPYTDVVPFPSDFRWSIWNKLKRQRNIWEAAKALYENNEVPFGTARPLPPSVAKCMKAPKYVHIKNNMYGKLMSSKPDSVDDCSCKPIDGKRCTPAHGCINRSVMVECPADCDERYLKRERKKVMRSLGRGSRPHSSPSSDNGSESGETAPMCTNCFLRNRLKNSDDLLMEVKMTNGKGFGVFAKTNLEKNMDLTEYVGKVIPMADYMDQLMLRAEFNDLETSFFGMQLTSDLCVDARHFGNISRCLNHSCSPNCLVTSVTVDGVNRLKVSTFKEIAAGEELTYDYAPALPSAFVGMKCRCGSTNCRGIIGKHAPAHPNGTSQKKNGVDITLQKRSASEKSLTSESTSNKRVFDDGARAKEKRDTGASLPPSEKRHCPTKRLQPKDPVKVADEKENVIRRYGSFKSGKGSVDPVATPLTSANPYNVRRGRGEVFSSEENKATVASDINTKNKVIVRA